MDEDLVASAREVLEIAELEAWLASGEPLHFTAAELAYARSKSDPARRLAARLAAKRAVVRLLGGGIGLQDVEVRAVAGGPPDLGLTPRAQERLRELGAQRVLVSLTHERQHAAAAVLLLRSRSA